MSNHTEKIIKNEDMYYEANLKLEKLMANGTTKKVTEKYLCDAICVSEVELKINEHLKELFSDEFAVNSVKKTKIEEILNREKEKLYSVKYGIVSLDEKTGNEKLTSVEILIGADNLECALDCFKEYMKGSMADWELLGIYLSPIVEVI